MTQDNNKGNSKDNTITIKKINIWQGLTVLFAVLFLISIFGGFEDSEMKTQTAKKATPKSTGSDIPKSISLEGYHAKGVEDAKVTIVEYSSFSCGYCNKVRGTIDQILDAYPEDVQVIYKHFDRGGTDSASAQAAECAGDQDKFWEMHDMIFDSGSRNFETYANNLGLDLDEFNTCISSEKYKSKVAESSAEGRKLGVGGTPSFVINGQLVVGAQPFDNFKQIIDAKLAE